MSRFLAGITHSSEPSGLRLVISGVEKIGKTTLACGAPRALLIPIESGYNAISVRKTVKPEIFQDVVDIVAEIKAASVKKIFPYQTIVFDSVTAMERLIHDQVLLLDPLYRPGSKKTVVIDSALGGYGKGHAFANDIFDSFLKSCDDLAVNHGINIVFTAHCFAGKIQDPTVGEYNTWEILLHSPKNLKTYGKREMLCQWADMIGFMHEEIIVDEKGKGILTGKTRLLGVSRTTGYVAGNRFGLEGVIKIPKLNGWQNLADAIFKSCKLDLYNRDN